MQETRQWKRRPPLVRRSNLMAAVAAVFLALPSASLSAQHAEVEGTVLEENGRAVSGALVTLEHGDGRTVRSTLSDGRGRFILPLAAEDAEYRLRTERMGYRAVWSDTFRPDPGARLTIDIQLPREPIPLDRLEVEVAEGRCVVDPETGTLLADLWGQARQVFARVSATETEAAFRFDLRRHERTVEILTGNVVAERLRRTRGSPVPFRSLPVERLLEEGWVQMADGNAVDYFGPDPELLLSDGFNHAHCFALRMDADRPDELGVAFEPAERGSAPAIRGILWMDRETAELLELRFQYTLHPHEPEMPQELLELFGGEMTFRSLPDGRWVVDRWALRMPAWSDGRHEGVAGRRDPALAERLPGIRESVENLGSWWWRNQIEQGMLVFHEEGGELARIEWPDGTVVAEREPEAPMMRPEIGLALPAPRALRALRGGDARGSAEPTRGAVSHAEAQGITGEVRDAATGEPVPVARVSLLTAYGDHQATTLTGEDGRFTFDVDSGGRWVLEAERLGYERARVEPFELALGEGVRRDVDLEPQPVRVDELVFEGSATALVHESSLAGAYARRARSPEVGGNRVLVRGDLELDAAARVGDVLPPSIRPSGPPYGDWCGILVVDGWDARQMGPEAKAFLLNLPVREVEAVEFYRDLARVPMGLSLAEGPRSEDWDFRIVRECGFLAVWRRDGDG